MATNADDMYGRLFSGTKPKEQEGPKAAAKAKPESEEQPKPKTKTTGKAPKSDSGKVEKSDGARLFESKDGAETKATRIQLAVRESDSERWRKAAKRYDVSLTRFIETVLNDFCERNGL